MRAKVFSAALLSLVTASAMATTAIPLPEPDTIGLLAAGAAAGLVAWLRKRRR